MQYGRFLKFERQRFKEEFDQRLETIPQGELEWRKSECRSVELGRDHIFWLSKWKHVLVTGQTWVYYNEPTTPLAHWPFRRQTAERSEVSPKVILMGWPKTQVSRSGSVTSYVCLAALLSLHGLYLSALCRFLFLVLTLTLIPYHIATSRETHDSLLRLILNRSAP